jgi:flagellar protein FliO/FliZ
MGSGAGSRRNANGVQVELLARRSMGRNVSIAVVRVADQAMVVGITDHQVTTLAQTELDELDPRAASANGLTAVNGVSGARVQEAQRTVLPTGPQGPAPTWKAMLEQLKDRTVRH